MFALILELFIYLEDICLKLSLTTSKSKLYFERNVVYLYKAQKALKITFKARIISEPGRFSFQLSWLSYSHARV